MMVRNKLEKEFSKMKVLWRLNGLRPFHERLVKKFQERGGTDFYTQRKIGYNLT